MTFSFRLFGTLRGTSTDLSPLIRMSDSIRSLASRDTPHPEMVDLVADGTVSRGPVMMEELENQRFQSDVDALYLQRYNLCSAERKPLSQRLKEPRDKRDVSRSTASGADDNTIESANPVDRVDQADLADPSRQVTYDQAEKNELNYLLGQFKRSNNGLSDEEKDALKEKYKNLTRSSFLVAEVLPTLSTEMANTFNTVKAVMGDFEADKNGKQHEALKLFDKFEENLGHVRLVSNLNKVAALNAKERMPSALSTRHVMNIWFAKNLLLIQSCYASATDLRGHFSGVCQLKAVASERETVRLLLKTPSMDDRSTDAFINKLFDPSGVDESQKAKACRAVRRCVSDLPITLWPIDALQQRQDFLIRLDEMAIGSDQQRIGVQPKKILLEIRERARIERVRHVERSAG